MDISPIQSDVLQPALFRSALVRSALEVAQLRALHQLVDLSPLFNDLLGLRIAGMSEVTNIDDAIIEATRTTRAFIAARSRFAEEKLMSATEHGVRQYIILGAGLDTSAHRQSQNIRIFEIDHPSTQMWKRGLLSELGVAELPNIAYVPMDFAQQSFLEKPSLIEQLSVKGFDVDKPVFVAMLGLVIYLDAIIVDDIFRLFAERARGAEIVFDYGIDDISLNEQQRVQRAQMSARAEQLGESFKTFFNTEALYSRLQMLGSRDIEHLDSNAINLRYFSNRDDNLSIAVDGRRLVSVRF